MTRTKAKRLIPLGAIFFSWGQLVRIALASSTPAPSAPPAPALTVIVTQLGDLLKATSGIVTIAISAILFSILFFGFRIELSKTTSAIISALFLLFFFGLQVLWKFNLGNIIVLFYCGVVAIGITVYIIIQKKAIAEMKKTFADIAQADVKTPDNELLGKIFALAKRRIRGHRSIESIQLYKIYENNNENFTNFRIAYIGSEISDGTNINAILSMSLQIEKETIENFRIIIHLFDEVISDPEAEGKAKAFVLLTEREIDRLKQLLSKLEHTDQVNSTHCCYARIIMVYLSLLCCLDNSEIGVFIGLKANSLSLDNAIEDYLFTHTRTGILGALLLEEHSYVFHYAHEGAKKGRKYHSYVINNSGNKYVALVSINALSIMNYGLERFLQGLETDIKRICYNEKEKGEEKSNEGKDTSESVAQV